MFNTKRSGDTELGFGSKNYQNSVRFLNKDGSVNIRRKGPKVFDTIYFYHWLITTSSLNLLAVITSAYVIINCLFAAVYFSIGAEHFGGIDGETSVDQFLGLFFFSAQTLTTLGYGHAYPIGTAASTVAAVESMMGLLGFALATGVIYGRFSRPRAEILYSDNVLISPYKGMTGLMFRIANIKQNELIEIEANITLSFSNPETNKREFVRLALERDKINFLTLSWTIVHPIDEKSPLYGCSIQDLIRQDAELIILIKAINDTYSQNVYSRNSYKPEEFIDNARFVPVKQESTPKGKIIINLTDIHKYERVE
jgi:inward rectifier potassium channel